MRFRPFALPVAGVVTVAAGLLGFGNLNSNLVYYLTPEEAVEQRADFPDERRFRLAGEVVDHGIERGGGELAFRVGGEDVEIPVAHAGVAPQLFQPGVPVVVEGSWDGEVFRSDTMLINHDEEYFPEDAGPHGQHDSGTTTSGPGADADEVTP